MKIPYTDTLPDNRTKRELPIKLIESTTKSSQLVLEQEFVDLGYPKGSFLSEISQPQSQYVIYVPGSPNPNPVPAFITPVVLDGKIYNKKETQIWKTQYINIRENQ